MNLGPNVLRLALVASLTSAVTTPVLWAQAVRPPSTAAADADEEQYFEESKADWAFDWGTDTTFTLANRERGSTNETNDRTTPFDALWLRLYGKLRYGERAELVIDLFSADAGTPALYGLYGRISLHRLLGVRVGLLPLVFGPWQERAYPSRQPLIGGPIYTQYLLPLRNANVPSSPADLLLRAQPGYTFPPSSGFWATLVYEHCWDTGIELFGQQGGLRYRVAVMEGTPGVPAAHYRLDKTGASLEGRLTYRFGESLRLGASFSRGPYLTSKAASLLRPGQQVGDFLQELAGVDAKLARGPLEVHAEYLFNRFGTPYTTEGSWPARSDLDTHGYAGEVDLRLAPGLTLAGRVSGLVSRTLDDGSGGQVTWYPDALRLEVGAVYRFWDDHVALKAAYQRTAVDQAPRRVESLGALQLAFSR